MFGKDISCLIGQWREKKAMRELVSLRLYVAFFDKKPEERMFAKEIR